MGKDITGIDSHPAARPFPVNITEMNAHPAARLFPMMDDVELAKLAEDIKKNGQHESIAVYDGMILDGRNRIAACKMLGIAPVFIQVEKLLEARQSSPVQYVIGKNLHRRHLTPSQQTMIAVEMVPMLQEEARKRQEAGAKIDTSAQSCAKGKVTEIAAKAVGVSTRMVEMGVAVKKHNPELSEKVRAGEVKVNAAYQKVRESQREKKEPTVRRQAELSDRERQRDARKKKFEERRDRALLMAHRMVTEGRRSLAGKQHPDHGGTAEEMAFINEIHDRLQRLIRDSSTELI